MYSILQLSGVFSETGPQTSGLMNSLNEQPRFRFDNFYLKVEALLKKKRVSTVLVHVEPDFQAGFLASAAAIRDQLKRLADSGKTLVFYSREYGLNELMMASVCQRRIIHPLGMLIHAGASINMLFYKKLLDKHRVSAQVVRIGRYKSALDSYRVSSIDEYTREQYQAVLDSVISRHEELTAEGYGLPVHQVSALKEKGMLSSSQALNAKWVTELASYDDVLAQFKANKEKRFAFKSVPKSAGKGVQVAVLVFEGAIVDGHNSNSRLNGQSVGASDFVPVIRKLREDSSVKAVVFRINSGGGSAIASDDIVREIARLREKKPVVVSMSAVAGSGGYWISTDADRIFAEHSTLTGSIGVIGGHFNISKFLEHHGITHSTLKNGEHADFMGMYRDLDERELDMFMRSIRDIYDKFLKRVSDARGLSVQQVDALGEGHVFSADHALKVGLVDEIGGIHQAVSYLADKIGKKSVKVVFYPKMQKSLLGRLLGGGGGSSSPYASTHSAVQGVNPLGLAEELAAVNGKAQAVTPGFSMLNGYWTEL